MPERRAVAVATSEAEDAPARQLRADARRNLESLLRSAQELLPDDPSASMGQIASHAGVHRATAHRHFASRDELVAAVRARALGEAVAAMHRALDGGPARAADRLEAVTEAMLRVGDAYRLHRFTTWRDERSAQSTDAIVDEVLLLVASAQREGDFRDDVPAARLRVAYGGLFEGVLPEIADGRMTIAEAAAFIRAMLACTPA